MATYYLRTDGSDANPGTADTAGGAWRTLEHAGAAVAAGDTVFVRGTAGNAAAYPTSSLDYAVAGFFTPAAGSTAAGYVRWIGLGVMPTIGCPGLAFYNCSYQWWEGLYFVATAAANASLGVLNGVAECTAKGCVVNLNLQASLAGLVFGGGGVLGTEIFGGGTSPTASSGADGISLGGFGTLVTGCRVHHCRGAGIGGSGQGAVLTKNLIHANAGRGIDVSGNATVAGKIVDNTVHGNGSDGVALTGTAGCAWWTVVNNNLTANGGYGLSVTDGGQALNDLRGRVCDYNNYGTGALANLSGPLANLSAGAHDLTADPGYANAAAGDFTPSNAALQGVAFPTSFP